VAARHRREGQYLGTMARYTVRLFGDPVLKQRAPDITEIDGALVQLTEDMVDTMRAAPGVGLAAPQVGVQKRLFVYQMPDENPKVVINPEITESRGEWEYEEGCLSVPGLYFPIVRPKEVHLTGYDLEGNEISIEADELRARLFQHEVDHLNGTLLLEYLDKDQKKAALRELRRRTMDGDIVVARGRSSQEL
jgi:peptide deformylase